MILRLAPHYGFCTSILNLGGWKQKMPIVDGKKIVISDSTKKKKPQRILPWHIFTLPQPAPAVLGLFSKRREC
jgi:hypothetical protein